MFVLLPIFNIIFQVVNIDATDSLIEHASTLFIIVGAFVFVVGFLGCCGALKKHPGMLFLVRETHLFTPE